MTYRKKLIEVALPLDAINAESAREKSIRHGHPSTLHLWWARRPLAACRAVLFASLVDDPGNDLPEDEARVAREKLFDIIRELVLWDNVNNETVLHAARTEIARSCARGAGVTLPAGELTPEQVRDTLEKYAPPVLDPFAGGGSIPLEAQRLGLKAYASDLNPVAVLINKALIEIPPKFAGQPPVNPEAREQMFQHEWRGAAGLAADVRYYGKWMRDEAERRIGHLYPKVRLPKEYGSGEATVIAWLWARTVKCPNPACGAEMPLVKSFILSAKKGRESWAEPKIDRRNRAISFHVRMGPGKPPEGTVNRRGARCLVCGAPVPFEYLRAESKANRMSTQLMAMVAEGQRNRVYLSPDSEQALCAQSAQPQFHPDGEIADNPGHTNVYRYGLTTFGDLFTARQLVALTTLNDLVREAREQACGDAVAAGLLDATNTADTRMPSVQQYSDALATYLGLGTSKISDYNSSLVVWSQSRDQAKGAFARQALPMVWDFAEVNPFAKAAGDLLVTVGGIAEALERTPVLDLAGEVAQRDAAVCDWGRGFCISTDPPYYDNIGYADLSDYFYSWLRRSLAGIYPDIFSTLLVPKVQELTASAHRFGGDKERAEHFFEQGLSKAFDRLRASQHQAFPLTVYYAFKQSESDDDVDGSEHVAIASTGWETMLEALIRAGFSVTGTWPMRTERSVRSVSLGANALASSIVLVCRPRPDSAPLATRREFLNALKRELPNALAKLTHGGVAPVDLAQASIGPGMAIYSRYAKVLEADGTPMGVRTALQIINQQLDEYLTALEGDLDRDTRFAVAWFEQYGHDEAAFGEADVLARAKDTAVASIVQAGILHSRAGKVRLLRRDEYPLEWDPRTDARLTVWECTQQFIRRLYGTGEAGAAKLMKQLGAGRSEDARALAYRLFAVCERKGWAEEALAYNGLVVSWPEIEKRAVRKEEGEQGRLL